MKEKKVHILTIIANIQSLVLKLLPYVGFRELMCMVTL